MITSGVPSRPAHPGRSVKRKVKLETIVFSATLPVEMRAAVEALFFFNPRQSFLRSAITAAIAKTGVPRIVEVDGRIWIDAPSHLLQCLFACDSNVTSSRPIGVVLYERPSTEIIRISHVAVDPAYVFGKSRGSSGLGVLLIKRVQEIARRIKGVRKLELPYRDHCFLRV